MFLVYTPEGKEPQRLEFKPGRARLAEQAQIERAYAREIGTKTSFLVFLQDVRAGHAAALRVLLHTLLRRQHPQIRYEDVDPYADEIELLYHKAELEELRDSFREAMPDGPEKDAYLAQLEMEIRRAPDADEGEPGKATGTTSSTSPGGSRAARSPRRGRSTT